MNSIKFLYLIIPTLGLAACSGQHPDSETSAATSQRLYNNTFADSGDVREPSHVHTYIVNDYVDPINPRLRHRGHLVDVVEQDEKWSLTPADTGETDLGPVTAVNDPNAAPNPYSAEFETELEQQRNQYRQLADLGEKMTAEMGSIQEMAEKSADVISENTELRNRLGELQQEIDTLKPASPPVSPDAPKKPSWLDDILSMFRQVPQGTPVAATKTDFPTNALLRPGLTNAPPTNSLAVPQPPQTNADDAIPSPGEMAQP